MLNVQVKNLDSVAVVSLQGQIVIEQTETLRDAVQSLPETSLVLLDLSRVTLIDAHGLGVMLQLREQTHAKGVGFQLVNVSTPMREILRITRLDGVFQINCGGVARSLAA